MSSTKQTAPAGQNGPEKPMTKYDRKMQARKEAQAREEKRNRITLLCTIAVIVAILLVVISTPISNAIKKQNAKKEYVRIGSHSVSQLDYEFYYGYSVNTFLNNYAYILPYMGLDTSVSFASQQYSENMTWQDYFNQITVQNIRQYLALADDAAAKGYDYDVKEDYEEFMKTMEESAAESNVSLANYLKSAFGTYATKSTIEAPAKTFLTAQSYFTHLLEQNAPTDDEISAYYEENKKSYDTVSHRVFEIAAEYAEDASEEEIAAALEAANEKAEEFIRRYQAGESYPDLCLQYGAKEDEETGGESSSSTTEDKTYSSTSSAYRDWLFEEERVEGDISVQTSSSSNTCYVVEFFSRKCPDTANESISETLAYNAAQEYTSNLTGSYTVVDEKNHLNLDAGISNNEEEGDENGGNENNGDENGGNENNGDENGEDEGSNAENNDSSNTGE